MTENQIYSGKCLGRALVKNFIQLVLETEDNGSKSMIRAIAADKSVDWFKEFESLKGQDVQFIYNGKRMVNGTEYPSVTLLL